MSENSDAVEPVVHAQTSGVLSNLRLLSLGTMISRVFGLMRDVAMTSLFGAGTLLDAFILAFRIPNLARQLLGEGALSTSFLPVYIRSRDEDGRQACRETLTLVAIVQASFLMVLLAIAELGIAICFLTMDLSESSRLLGGLLAIMLPYGVFICTSALFCAALQANRQFLWPAFVPVIFNCICLTSVAVVNGVDLPKTDQICWLAVCVVLAGFVQMLIPLLSLQRQELGLVKSWTGARKDLRTIVNTMIPILIGMSILQIGAMFDSLTAWTFSVPDDGGRAWCEAIGLAPMLHSGTASAVYLGQRLLQFPLGIFGIALGSVLYPVLTRHAQRGEMDAFRFELSRGIRICLAIGVPASVGLALIANELTTAVFRWGEFSREDADLTAQMIFIYSAGVWSTVMLTVLNRAWYAAINRITPMKLGLVALAINQMLVYSSLWWLGGASIPLGAVIANGLLCLLTLWLLNRKIGGLNWSAIVSTFVKTFSSAAIMLLAVLVVKQFLPEPVNLPTKLLTLGIPCAVGAFSFGVTAYFLKMKEIAEVLIRK